MEAFNSSVSILNNISKVDGYPDNITIPPDESNGTTGYVYTTADLILIVSHIIIITFGSIGNILTFIIMRRGSMKYVSTCFYMSILALADTGETIEFYIICCFCTIDLKIPIEFYPY